MPWNGSAPSQTFGRTDGTRTGETVWQEANAAGVKIVNSAHDTHDEDIADSLNLALLKNGGNTATANIPMGGFTHTNIAAATARTMPARFSDVQDGKAVYYPTVGGTANAVTITGASAAITAYAAGQTFRFIAASTNSDAVTINVDSVGAKNIYSGTSALTAGQIVASRIITVTYDGTQFQLVEGGAVPAAISVGTVMAWPMTTVPSGWLECDGSAISRTTYAALFAVISTSYGIGNGSTTFNLPNYKDYFLRGFDASGTNASTRTDRGDGTTGASVGTKQSYDSKAHTHTFTTSTDGLHGHTLPTSIAGFSGTSTINPAGATVVATGPTFNQSADTAGLHSHTGTTVAYPTSVGDETRPKNITVKWIILASVTASLALGTGFTSSPRTCHTGGMPARVSTDGTNATPVTTETYICEVHIPGNCTVTGISLMNGDAVAGSIVVGLANSSGGVLVNSALAGTAQSGTDAYQRIPFTAAYSAVGPATYYVLVQFNNTSARFNTHTFGDFGASKKTAEVFGTLTTITVPTTFTTALGPIASLY